MKKPKIRPLRATYNPDAPYVVDRHEGNSIQECIDAALTRSKAQGG